MKLFLKKAVPFLLLAGLSTLCQGQINMADFLTSAAQEKELDIYQRQISWLTNKPFRMAPVRELEFRTQSNEIGANEQRYGLRLSPANPWEIRNTKKVFNTYQSLLSIQKELAFKEILTIRYLTLAEFLYLKDMQQLKAELVKNLKGQIGIMEKQSGSDFFDAEDYVQLKLELMEEQADLETFDFYLAQKVKEIERIKGKESSSSAEGPSAAVISLAKLESVADSLLEGPLYMNRLAYRKEKIKLAENEYALEKSDINPGFIQADYSPYRYAESKSPVGINLGITIPVFNPNKGKMAEQKLEILESESELELEKHLAAEELENLLNSFRNLLERHKNLENQLSSFDLKKMLSAVNSLNSDNPSIALKFNVRLLKIQKLQLEVKHEIFSTYIRILSASDLLIRRPLVNYLSEELEVL